MYEIVITGVAGFIGSSLAYSLCEKGYSVIGIDSLYCGYLSNLSWVKPTHKFTFHQSSINTTELNEWIKKDQIIIHLACISSLPTNQEDPQFSYTNNVSSMVHLLEVCRIKGVKQIIYASTAAIYENTDIFPTPENIVIKPTLIYSLVKKHCEDIIQSYHDVYALPFSTLRLFNIYGLNQDILRKNPSLIAYLFDCFKNKKQPILHSDGEQKRDYVYLDDLINLIEKLIESEPLNTEINVCSGTTISVNEIVKIVQEIMNVNDIEPIYRDPTLLWEKSSKIWEGEYPFSKERMINEVKKYSLGDPSKAIQLINWTSKITFKEGIKLIYENHKF